MAGRTLVVEDNTKTWTAPVRENRVLRREVPCDCSCLIGVSPVLREICQTVGKVADTRSPVLVVGESGTGKELIARSVHYNSPRREQPMVTVNCGAIPQDLLESELFGHTKGAFTGAVSAKRGLLEEAAGSTLFLDEIGELDPDLQVKLLRVIEEGEFRRVGDNRTVKVDFRVVAATNKNLEAEISAGHFRDDLYYRLNVVCIRVPPLRERREDIPVLARHFLEKYARIHGRKVEGVSDAAMKMLMSWTWPGNVRELEHVIERAVVLGDDRIIQPCDLPFGEEKERAVRVEIPPRRMNLKETLDEVVCLTEQVLIHRALRQTDSNHSRASRLLGISRRTLLYKLKRYGDHPLIEPV